MPGPQRRASMVWTYDPCLGVLSPLCFAWLLRFSRKSMDLVGALGVLVRVAETGSFFAVARERGASQAAVTRQISQLEEHFGVRLLHRTTRKLSLTDDGQMLFGLARPVLDG